MRRQRRSLRLSQGTLFTIINYQNWSFLRDIEHVPVPNLSHGEIITNQCEPKNCHRLDIHGIVYVMVGPNAIDGQDKKRYCEEKAEKDANCLEWECDEGGYQGVKSVTYLELVDLGQPNDSVRVNTFLPLRSD